MPTSIDKEKIKEIADRVCELTKFGQALHPNDIIPDLEELVARFESELEEKVEEIANIQMDLCENSQAFKEEVLSKFKNNK